MPTALQRIALVASLSLACTFVPAVHDGSSGGAGTEPDGSSGGAGTEPDGADAPAALAGEIDPGHFDTDWASACPSGSEYGCVAGTWSVKDPTPQTMPAVRFQTAHFALRWQGDAVGQAQAEAGGRRLEEIWDNHTRTVGFIEPYCKDTQKYKVNVHIDPSFGLTGSGTGERDPAFWIYPAALSDVAGLAHEFAHALQFASRGLRDSPYVGWFWENHAEFMAHRMPQAKLSNAGCTELFVNFPHLNLGSTRNRYCTWLFLEYLRDRYCDAAVNRIWTEAKKPQDAGYREEDPFALLAKIRGWSPAELNDFFGEWMLHNVSWDYRDLDGSDQGEQYRRAFGDMGTTEGGTPGARWTRVTRLRTLDANQGIFHVPPAWAPQRWGYNLVRLYPAADANLVTVRFRGVVQAAPANTNFGPYQNQPGRVGDAASDWRWGLVAVSGEAGRARYSQLQRGSDGALRFALQENERLWLLVMATPSVPTSVLWDQMHYTLYRYPWMVQLLGALPEGRQRPPTGAGRIWPNGGGWVADAATVASTVYVGPDARVLGGQVQDAVRVEEEAVVVDAKLSGQARVRGMSVLAGGIEVSGQAVIDTSFQPPGTFARNQRVGGSAQLVGDVELRDDGLSLTQGVFYGFVNNAVKADVAQGSQRTAPVPEVTAAPPYVWRP